MKAILHSRLCIFSITALPRMWYCVNKISLSSDWRTVISSSLWSFTTNVHLVCGLTLTWDLQVFLYNVQCHLSVGTKAMHKSRMYLPRDVWNCAIDQWFGKEFFKANLCLWALPVNKPRISAECILNDLSHPKMCTPQAHSLAWVSCFCSFGFWRLNLPAFIPAYW